MVSTALYDTHQYGNETTALSGGSQNNRPHFTCRDAAGPVASALSFLISLRGKCCWLATFSQRQPCPCYKQSWMEAFFFFFAVACPCVCSQMAGTTGIMWQWGEERFRIGLAERQSGGNGWEQNGGPRMRRKSVWISDRFRKLITQKQQADSYLWACEHVIYLAQWGKDV